MWRRGRPGAAPSTSPSAALPYPNCIFVQALCEWEQNARDRNLMSHHAYRRAAASLQKYPLPLLDGAACTVLEGIGSGVALQLDKYLAQYEKKNGRPADAPTEPAVTIPSVPKKRSKSSGKESQDDGTVKKRAKKAPAVPKAYIPPLRSGPYAIVIALRRLQESPGWLGYATREDIIDVAQPLCESSFTISTRAGMNYTAWSSMSQLVDRGLVCKTGNPIKYSLSDEGIELADQLQTATSRLTSSSDSSSQASYSSSQASQSTQTTTTMTASIRGSIASSSSSSSSSSVGQFASQSTVRSTASFSSSSSSSSSTVSKVSYSSSVSVNVQRPIVISLDSDESDDDLILASSAPASHSEPLRPASTLTRPEPAPMRPQTAPTGASSSSEYSLLKLSGSCLDVVLLLDSREVRGKADRTFIQEQLLLAGVTVETRALVLGDAMWVARPRGAVPGVDEVVLDFIVERKRIDDLVSSIKDKRFQEQKFRLRNCGVPNVMYIIEENATAALHLQPIDHQRIATAAMRTQVHDGFFVRRTSGMDETIRFLVHITTHLASVCASLPSIEAIDSVAKEAPGYEYMRSLCARLDNSRLSFKMFSALNSRSVQTLGELFAKQLVQLRGIGSEKAVAVLELFPTVQALMAAYRSKEGGKAREMMLADVEMGPGRRVGPMASKVIYHMFCSESQYPDAI